MNPALKKIISWLFPRICMVCRADISPARFHHPVCPPCLQKINWNPLWGEASFQPLDGFFAGAEFAGPMRDILHLFKYQKKDYLGPMLAGFLTSAWNGLDPNEFEAIVPIPMSYWRETFRGYNHAEVLARHIGKSWGVPVITNLLKKRWLSRSQTKLGQQARARNAQLSLGINPRFKPERIPKTILLLDDICTTGATLKRSGELLKKMGAKVVFGATVAYETYDRKFH